MAAFVFSDTPLSSKENIKTLIAAHREEIEQMKQTLPESEAQQIAAEAVKFLGQLGWPT